MSQFREIITIDLAEVASEEALLDLLGDVLELGGPNGNVPVSGPQTGRGWGKNWDALEDSLGYLNSGGIWGTARKISFPLSLRIVNCGALRISDPRTVSILESILSSVSERYAQDGLQFTYVFS